MEASGSTPNFLPRAGGFAPDNLQSAGGSSQSIRSQPSASDLHKNLPKCLTVDDQTILGGYLDITAQLAAHNLPPPNRKNVLAPSPSMGAIREALAQLPRELPIESGKPLTREGFAALRSLNDLRAVSSAKFDEISRQSLRASSTGCLASAGPSAVSLLSAGAGAAARSTQSLLDPGQPSSSSTPAQAPVPVPVPARPAAQPSPSSPSADTPVIRRPGSDMTPLAVAAAGSEPGDNPDGVVQAANRASGFAQVRQSRYWPQNKWSWFFLVCAAWQTLTAVEKGIQAIRRISNPEAGEPIRLRVAQILEVPTGAFAVVMFAYLMINKAALASRRAAEPRPNSPARGLDNV